MAKLPDHVIDKVLELEKHLILIIDKTTATAFVLLEKYGETEKTLVSLNDLDNIRERANTYYSRLYNLLQKITDAQPIASNAILNLLEISMSEAQANIDASEATIKEEKINWSLS